MWMVYIPDHNGINYTNHLSSQAILLIWSKIEKKKTQNIVQRSSIIASC
jgi:hypothetical protein